MKNESSLEIGLVSSKVTKVMRFYSMIKKGRKKGRRKG